MAPGVVRSGLKARSSHATPRWPLDCAFERAAALGLRRDASIDALVRSSLESRTA